MEKIHYPCRPGQREQFEGIYFATRASLFHYIRKFVQTGQDSVEDVLQECYIRLWENMDKIEEDADVMPLLRTYAINFSINQLKKYARAQVRETAWYDQREQTTELNDNLSYRSTMEKYQHVVSSMPPQRKLVYQLIKEQGLSYQAASERLGISTKTIERHITEAMRTLRLQFTPETVAGIAVVIYLGA
jgi:RNA polymerase sigma-70 factor (ECF subfamily)